MPRLPSPYRIIPSPFRDSLLAIRQRENIFTRSFSAPETEISKLVANLDYKTNLTPIRACATFDLTEQSRADEVQRQIGEIHAKAIPNMVEHLEQTKAAFKNLLDNIVLLESTLGEVARETYAIQLSDLIYRNRVVTEQGAASFKTDFLKSTGGYEWEAFIASAQDLATLEDENYPLVGDRCLLCQQPLDGASHALLHRIWEFLASEAHTKAHEAMEVLHKSIETLESLKLDFFSNTTSCYNYVNRLDPAFTEKVSALIEHAVDDYYNNT